MRISTYKFTEPQSEAGWDAIMHVVAWWMGGRSNEEGRTQIGHEANNVANDDIIWKWEGDEESFRKFVKISNNTESRIEVKESMSWEKAIFLDVEIKTDDGHLKTDLY